MIICKKIGDTFAQSMVDNNQISLEDREVYSYCVEYALDLVCFNGSLLLMGVVLHNFLNSVIYLLTLVPLKMMADGAHANSRKMCSLISYSVFFMVLLLSQVSVGNYYILQFILFLLLIGVVIMTPVEHPDQSFSLRQRKRLKTIATIYSCFLFGMSLFLLEFAQVKYCVTLVLCVLVVFSNQIIGILLYKSWRKVHDTEDRHLR